MIVSAEELQGMPEFRGVSETVLQRKLDSAEHLVRAYTNNNFQNRAVRFRAASLTSELITDETAVLGFLRTGDTVEISQSEVNDGLYTVKMVNAGRGISVSRDLFPVDYNLVTKVEYPADIKEGVINLLIWDVQNRGKVGVKSETLSRHSVTYFDLDVSNQLMGYPVSLLGFLTPYVKARF